ncbi:BON domain-containing protein [Roseateles toxinivorans]|uniref:Hyperosmotically inducible protein n=1 Tax=Roseateles toxinivorans TaxID=270368 RepID=A0A4R6QUB5_9BURK|nr:BON domain-containing protein [Roseateles toxinivorans]TDP74763.1 hyperosmotically inducible protein [Roseateles toxinivorans]
MNAIKRMTLLATAATALMLAGCDQPVETAAKAGPKIEAPVAKVANTAEQAKIALADAAITAKIKIELAEEPSLAVLQIKVDTKDGLVDLTGTAPDATLRDRATRVAATVKGVLSVDNHMVVANG